MIRRTRQIVTLQVYLVSLGTIPILRFIDICLVLGVFTKLRKATAGIVMSVLSVRMEQLGSLWTDFNEV